jgi:hypothetical protein
LAKKKKTEKAPRELTRRQISAHRRQLRRQRIILFGGGGIIAVIVLVILAGWVTSEYIPLHRTVIEVNDKEFDTGDFIGYLEVMALSNQQSSQSGPDLQTLANSAAAQIPRNEVTREAAEQLGITVSDDEVEEFLENADLPVNDGSITYIRSLMLQDRLRSDYFEVMVPESDNQVWCNAMLLESDVKADEIRNQLVLGDNFTALAAEDALNYYSRNVNSGDFGWNPIEVLRDQLGSDIPTDFAFSAEVGTLSQPLDDPEMYKQLGYWLIRVNEKISEDEADVDAILVSSEVLAYELRLQLEATDNISSIADEYTQYSPSKQKHGYLGVVNRENMTEDFNNYVFESNIVLGKWSPPIVDETLWTQGGSWLVGVVDRADDRALSSEDREYLIGKRYDEWATDLDAIASSAVNTEGLTEEVQQWAIERVTRFLEKYQQG